MPAVIDTISPGRARDGEILRINGSGFGSFGHNALRVDDGTGFATVPGADVTTISSTTIDFVWPSGLVRDRHVVVEVTNNEDNTSEIWWVYSQLTLTELETNTLPAKKAGFRESQLTTAGVPDEDPTLQEAKDWNRIGSKTELAQSDLFTTLGDVAARAATGMRRIPVGADGQRYFRDESLGGQWRTLEPEVAWWAGQIVAATVTEVFLATQLQASASPLVNATEQLVLVTGKLTLLIVHVTEDSTGTTSRINRVRILVNGTEEFDSNNLPFDEKPLIVENDHWTLAPWLDVTAGDRMEIAVTKSNATNTLNVIARAMIL